MAAISAFTRVFDALWRPSKDAANCFSFSRCAAPRHSGRASVASESRNHRRCRKIPDGPGYGFRVRAPARPGMTPYESVLAAPTRPSHAHHQPHDPEKWSCGFRTKIMRKQRRGGAPKGASSHGRPSFPSLSLRKVSGGGSAAILARIARLPALHGGTCPGERTPGLSPGRASREIKETRRRYPRRHSRLSGAPRTPIVMPEGTMPGPPGSGVTNPARGNRTRSVSRCVSRPRPSRARFPGDYLPVDKYSQAWQYAPTLRPQGEKPCHGNRNQSRK